MKCGTCMSNHKDKIHVLRQYEGMTRVCPDCRGTGQLVTHDPSCRFIQSILNPPTPIKLCSCQLSKG